MEGFLKCSILALSIEIILATPTETQADTNNNLTGRQGRDNTLLQDDGPPLAMELADTNLQWAFPSTVIKDWRGREGKIGDTCFYTAWAKHAQPVLEAMKAYNQAKQNVAQEYEKALSKGKTKQVNKEEFIYELAQNIAKARNISAENVKQQLISKSLEFPYDIREAKVEDVTLIMELLCESGELLQCKQIGTTEFGVCHCFDMEEGKPLYTMTYEDGHCRGVSGSTCNGEDPVISNVCEDKLTCIDFSKGACEFEFGSKFHCSGYPRGNIGKQNLFCSRRAYHPEHPNDYEGRSHWWVLGSGSGAGCIQKYYGALIFGAIFLIPFNMQE